MRVLLALAAATALLLCGTAWRTLSEQRRSAGCEMTYMYANYVEIPVVNQSRSHRRYKLYLYREDGGPSKQSELPLPNHTSQPAACHGCAAAAAATLHADACDTRWHAAAPSATACSSMHDAQSHAQASAA